MEKLAARGEATIRAHLLHLKEHGEIVYFNQGLQYLQEKGMEISMAEINKDSGCPGSMEISFKQGGGDGGGSSGGDSGGSDSGGSDGGGTNGSSGGTHNGGGTSTSSNAPTKTEVTSQLCHWPIQLHLINPQASFLQNADVLLTADCAAYAFGGFHDRYLKNHALLIACPKLDSGKEIYIEKLTAMIDLSSINTLTVVIMEVPCCSALLQLAEMAVAKASRKIPIKKIVLGIHGEVLEEQWT